MKLSTIHSVMRVLMGALLVGQTSNAALRVSEWGTFTSLIGSNGKPQAGMYHEDERLPAFVHGHGVTQSDLITPPPPPIQPPPNEECHGKGGFNCDFLSSLDITQKMETPVLYFYSDIAQRVSVDVKFPMGVVSDTFPAPVETFPKHLTATNLGNGETKFEVIVQDPNVSPQMLARLPVVASDNIYSHARGVNSNLVTAGNEVEKFIFYRGMGRFEPKVSVTSRNGALTINQCDDCGDISNAFLVNVDAAGQSRMLSLGAIAQSQEKKISQLRIQMLQNETSTSGNVLSGEAAMSAIHSAIVRAGLSFDEATAMVKTWEHGYLKTPGLRVLYVLPKSEVESMLPLSITPTPDAVTRVFIGRLDLMLDQQEILVVDQVLAEQDAFDVTTLGRMAEPKLRRAREVYIEQTLSSPVEAKLALFDRLIKRAVAIGNP